MDDKHQEMKDVYQMFHEGDEAMNQILDDSSNKIHNRGSMLQASIVRHTAVVHFKHKKKTT